MDDLERDRDARLEAIPDSHGHAKGEHKPFAEERPIPYTARMLFLWFYHACRRGGPRFMMVADHVNYLTFEDPAAVNLVRRALKLAHAGDLYGASETAGVDVQHAAVVSEGLRRGMRYSIGAEVDNDPRNRPDAQNIVDAMRPDAIIRSIHFLTIDHAELGAGYQWAFDNPEFKQLYDEIGTEKVWELYMAALLEAIDKLPGHIVGHFYVPAKFGHWPDDQTLQKYEDQLVEACAERGFAIEVNARIFYRTYVEEAAGGEAPGQAAQAQRQRYFDVHLRLLEKAKARGVAISVGSDAHSPRDQGNGFDAVLQMLDAAEINEIAFPINGRMARVALRATEELLNPPPPEPVQVAVATVAVSLEDEDDEDDDERPAPAAAPLETPAAAAPKPARKRPSRAAARTSPEAVVETATFEETVVETVVETVSAGPDGSRQIEVTTSEQVAVVESTIVVETAVAAEPPKRRAPRPKKAVDKDPAPVAEAHELPPPADEPAAKPAAVKPPAATKPPVAAGKATPKTAASKPAPKPPAAKPAAAKPASAKAAPAKPATTKAPAVKAKPAAKTPVKPAPAPARAASAKKAAAKPAPRPAAKKPAARPASKKTATRPPARKAAAKPAARKAAPVKKAAPAKRVAPKTAKRSAPAKRVAKKTPAKAAAKKKPSKPRR